MEAAASNEVAFGLTGPEIVLGAVVLAGVYYIGRRMFRAVTGQSNG